MDFLRMDIQNIQNNHQQRLSFDWLTLKQSNKIELSMRKSNNKKLGFIVTSIKCTGMLCSTNLPMNIILFFINYSLKESI